MLSKHHCVYLPMCRSSRSRRKYRSDWSSWCHGVSRKHWTGRLHWQYRKIGRNWSVISTLSPGHCVGLRVQYYRMPCNGFCCHSQLQLVVHSVASFCVSMCLYVCLSCSTISQSHLIGPHHQVIGRKNITR